MSARRILIVDDNLPVLEVLKNLLRMAGHEVFATADGPSGIALVREQTVDLAIVDIDMPGMNGHEVCAHFQAEPALRAIPVVLMTGRNLPGTKEKALQTGAAGFIAKPFDQDLLTETIVRLTRRPPDFADAT